MITYNPVMYVDVGFFAVLDKIEQYFGEGLVAVEYIITTLEQIIQDGESDEWSKECLDIFKEIKQSAEQNEFTGDVLFYN